MSGAAALSAAKRRRGGSGQPASAPVPSQRAQGTNNAAPPQQGRQITPIQMLQQHNVRIAKLETASKESHNGETSQDFSQELMKRVEMLEKSAVEKVSEPTIGEKMNATESKEDLEYFRNKTLLLEQQISELKQMMLKIQTFAMETSMSLMKYKNGIDIEEQVPMDMKIDESESEPEPATQERNEDEPAVVIPDTNEPIKEEVNEDGPNRNVSMETPD